MPRCGPAGTGIVWKASPRSHSLRVLCWRVAQYLDLQPGRAGSCDRTRLSRAAAFDARAAGFSGITLNMGCSQNGEWGCDHPDHRRDLLVTFHPTVLRLKDRIHLPWLQFTRGGIKSLGSQVYNVLATLTIYLAIHDCHWVVN